MDKKPPKQTFRLFLKKILQYFLQGLVVLAPIGITIWVVLALFNFVDDILPNIVHVFLPDFMQKDGAGNLKKIPGLGFIVVIVIVLIVGRISSSFLFSKIVNMMDSFLENTPGIKFIYSSVKDFFEAFAGNKKKFDKPVLVNVDATNVWRVGFITQKNADHFEIIDHVVVYVPHSYAISGITYIVPRQNVRILNNISASEAMKFAVSGGVTDVGDQSAS
ncbi:hypothetical protein GALL_124500 [mine drainage metagenome]|uniref:DUF502 domain-containing protein n=1 Tax=mine drainage metagenome TaxID=410659 RepID=A0A1J5SAN8_9ZZZZ